MSSGSFEGALLIVAAILVITQFATDGSKPQWSQVGGTIICPNAKNTTVQYTNKDCHIVTCNFQNDVVYILTSCHNKDVVCISYDKKGKGGECTDEYIVF